MEGAENKEVKTKKCIKCAMDIPEEATKCPYCRSNQKSSNTSTTIFFSICLAAVAFFAFSFVNKQYHIDIIKDSYLSKYSTTRTIGEAFGSFLDNAKWNYIKKDGNKIVSVTGSLLFFREPTDITVEFLINEEEGYFEVYRIKEDEKYLSILEMNLFLMLIYPEASKDFGESEDS